MSAGPRVSHNQPSHQRSALWLAAAWKCAEEASRRAVDCAGARRRLQRACNQRACCDVHGETNLVVRRGGQRPVSSMAAWTAGGGGPAYRWQEPLGTSKPVCHHAFNQRAWQLTPIH